MFPVFLSNLSSDSSNVLLDGYTANEKTTNVINTIFVGTLSLFFSEELLKLVYTGAISWSETSIVYFTCIYCTSVH